jgi:hypothetical protein
MDVHILGPSTLLGEDGAGEAVEVDLSDDSSPGSTPMSSIGRATFGRTTAISTTGGCSRTAATRLPTS